MQTTFDQIHSEPEIDSAAIRLYFLSRDRSVLVLLALLILMAAVGVAWMVGAPKPVKLEKLTSAEELKDVLQKPLPDVRRVVDLMLTVSPALLAEMEFAFSFSSLSPEEKLVTSAMLASLKTGVREPNARMLILAHQPRPAPLANEGVAELFARGGRVARAREYYLRELEFHPEESVRAKLVAMLTRHGALAALAPLTADPEFAAQISASLRLKIALHQRAWSDAAHALTDMEKETLHLRPLVLALIAGAAWLVIAVQAGQPRSVFSFRTIAPLLAVVAGCLAAWPAHYVSAWQEEVLGLRETGDFLADFAFYVGSVAPREELIKVVLMLPFVPFLVARGSALEILVVTGCVGLGFAIEGNLQTYQHAGPSDAFGRLLTSNFFHFAASGLLGLAFCKWLCAPRERLLRFLAVLLGVIVAHGIYDAFMNVAGLRILSAASMLSFFIIAQVFFCELRRRRDHTTDQLFLAATFVISLTILAGATLVIAAMEIGFQQAVNAMTANAIGLILVVLIFFRLLGRKLSTSDDLVDPSTS